jgi:hypothetical protein
MQESRTEIYRDYELVVEIAGDDYTGLYVLRQTMRRSITGASIHVPRVNVLFGTVDDAFDKTFADLRLLVDQNASQPGGVIDFSEDEPG